MNDNRIQLLLHYIEEQPEDPFNVYALAMEYRDEQPDQALLYLTQLLDQHPAYLPTYYHAAALYAEQENRAAAEEIYRQGIELARAQKNEKAFQELSRAYRAFQDDDDS
ncbi:tetratricopeptide repeat protein [Larkinella punicea]|uniref:Tetratricopeptide repeat protein n=1 Tax=Larkinella punicea TaxID=2315727 RepID=A0A368JG63_9BACT|nr:tetratricopeptide repeat protein [Larkinella punicea]RCR66658.1 tetratricopeptide repeat protein [Larkinella punicea]